MQTQGYAKQSRWTDQPPVHIQYRPQVNGQHHGRTKVCETRGVTLQNKQELISQQKDKKKQTT